MKIGQRGATVRRGAWTVAGALLLLAPAPTVAAQDPAPVVAEARALLEAGDLAAALRLLDAALAASASEPGTAELHRLRAEVHVGRLDYPAAVEALGNAPRDARTLRLEIRLLAMLGRDAEARRSVGQLAALDPPDASRAAREADLEVAVQLRESGLLPEAALVLGAPAPAESPARTLERGRLRLATDDCEGALPLLRAAASASEPPEGAAAETGRCLTHLGRREEAVRWLRRAVEASPSDREVRFRLGQLLLQSESPDLVEEGRGLLVGYEAARLRERRRALLFAAILGSGAADDGPGNSALAPAAEERSAWIQLLGLLLDAADSDPVERAEAGRVLAAARARFPSDPALRIARARLQLAEQDPAAAVVTLDSLIPLPRESLAGAPLSAARWQAEAHLRAGDPAASAALFDRVLAAAGDLVSPRVRSVAATAFAMGGDLPRALAEFDRVLEVVVGPARAAPLTDSALVLEMLRRDAEAEARYRAALAADPEHGPARASLAELLRCTGRPEEAEALLRPRRR